MILKAPFHLPPGFLPTFGYKGNRRFVGVWWEVCGDEAAFDDGISSAVGMSDNWLFLDFLHRDDVGRWVDENHLNLGSSDEASRHWLVVDGLTNDLYAAPTGEA